MNTLQRPLFRQVGGPAEIMPQASPVEMVEAVEQTTASNMEAMGQDYVQGMMQGLDGAQDFKQVIDSLRGNAMPLEERYLELSEYVGEDDAEKTPESVLAMVQPVIMMTEEGNVDSGIGQLMESLAGDVDMMTEAGQPTNMGQGVGGLIAANQEAPVQQFANGGQVQHFFNGGGTSPMYGSSIRLSNPITGARPDLRVGIDQLQSRLPQTYQEVLPLFQGIIDPQQQKEMLKSQTMFDIAQAGLNFAGGVDPRTGQSMTKRSMGSQLAAAASGLPQQIGERVAAQRQQEQGAKLAALQMAGGMETARLKQVGGERGLGAEIAQRAELAIFDADKVSAITNQEGAIQDALAENQREFIDAQSNKDVGRQNKIKAEEYRLETDLVGVKHKQALSIIEQNFLNDGDTRRLQSDLNIAEDSANNAHQLNMQKDAQEFIRIYKDAEKDIAKELAELQIDKFNDFIKRSPSTLYGSGGLTGFLWLDSEAKVMRQREQELMIKASELNMDTQLINNFLNTSNYRLDTRKQQFFEQTTYVGQLIEREIAMSKPGLIKGINSNQLNSLLMDDQAAMAYGLGTSMPEYEYALSQKFKTSFDPNTGLRITANMPPNIKSAIEMRQQGGFTAFSPQYAKGGEVRNMANGGDPFRPDPSKGLYEPTTGRYMARPPEAEQPITFDQPIISDIGRGIDITKGTGSDAFLKKAMNKVITALPGMENAMFEETEEAIRTLDSFTQIALTRALGSLAGRENKELQERLAKLQVPAAEFFYNDSEALAQFRASSRVMDFAIREQQSIMQGPGLTRTERNKAKKDLGSLKSIKIEYDNIANAYSRKLEGDTAGVSSQLDQFFN